VTGYQVSSFNAVSSQKTWYCLNLDCEDRAMSLRFRAKHTRDMFLSALQNLSKGRTWNGIYADAEAETEPEPEPEPEPDLGIASDALASGSTHGTARHEHQQGVGGSAVTYTSSRDLNLDAFDSDNAPYASCKKYC